MVSEKLRIDPHSPAYEAARAEMVEVLRQIGREDSRNGYMRMADDLAAGNRMEVPTWIALALMARAPAEQTGWQPIETVDRTNGKRLILAWDDCPSLPYHWEVGRWSRTLGWVNTYGHAFSGEPTHWMEPTAPSCTPPGTTRAPADLRSALEAETDEFATVEEWEHDDQRELSLLYNHRADDSLQFTRGQMREAIRHGKRRAALAPTKEPAA